MIAKFEGIGIEQVYTMPTLQALNDMAYLKARIDYEISLNKKK